MQQLVQTPIGFSDSSLLGYQRDREVLVVRVRCWNGRVALVRFRDVLGVRELLASEFSALVEGSGAGEDLLDVVLSKNFEAVPQDHPYRSYSFLDHDDQPALQVVAASCQVALEP